MNALTALVRRLLHAVILLCMGGILFAVWLLPSKRRHRHQP